MIALGLPQLIVVLVGVQRLSELWLSRRNERRLRAAGGIEYGRGHYPLIVALHALWLAALFFGVAADAPLQPIPLAAYLLLQPLRYWAIRGLGGYWTTRVISLPDAPLTRRGPYRWLRHPNYLVVMGEIVALPLAFDAWEIAAIFAPLNAILLWRRIAVENAALAARRQPAAPRAAFND